jgi:hypothetical protein
MGMSKGQKERYRNDPEYRARECEKHNEYCRKRYHSAEHHERALQRSRQYRIDNGCIVGRFHGLFKTRSWRSWDNMRKRVLCPSNSAYERYKKFSIDPRWEKFINFYEDMGDCPGGLTLDRKNNNEGYCKENCRWATPTQQSRNRNSCVLNEGMVITIRERSSMGESNASIGRHLGVKTGIVYNVVSGRSWKEVGVNA